MEIGYRQTREDHFNAARHISKRLNASSKWRFLPVFSGGVFGCFLATGVISIGKFYGEYDFIDTSKLDYGLAAVIFATMALIIGLGLYKKMIKALIFEEDGLYLAQQSYSIKSDYLIHRMGDSINMHSWKHIRDTEKTGKYIFLYIDRGAALYIPRHAFESDERYQIFFNALRENATSAR